MTVQAKKGPIMNRCVCATKDRDLRRLVHRTLRSAGFDVQFVEGPEDLRPVAEDARLILMDRDSGSTEAINQAMSRLPAQANIVLIGGWTQWNEVLDLMRSSRCQNLLCRRAPLEEEELTVTSAKLVSRDIFGLEKYVLWGTVIHEVEIATYDDKRMVIQDIAAFARSVGCRRHVVSRIEVVADELLMNALYDAPAAAQGLDRKDLLSRAVPGGPPISNESVLVRYASDGRFLTISVKDRFGLLKKSDILDNLARAATTGGSPLRDPRAGAGLGLYFVMQSVSRLVINVSRGQATEAICFFDIRRPARKIPADAHSLNIFLTDPDLQETLVGAAG